MRCVLESAARKVSQPMRTSITAVFILMCFASLNAQEQTGTIIFYREPHFGGSNSKPPMLFCDGVELARIKNGAYFQITAPEGLHRCTSESVQRPAIEVNVLAGHAAYVHVVMKPERLKEHAVLTNTLESEYDKEEGRLKPLTEWSRDTLKPSQPANANSLQPPPPPVEPAKPPRAVDKTDSTIIPDSATTVTTDRDVEATPPDELQVFVTHRKSWLASGGFAANLGTGSQALEFTKDFHKRCPKVQITDMQSSADYAVTIDVIGLLDSLTGPTNQPTFKVAVYARGSGLLYSGGTSFLKNAIKDACNAIGTQ